MTKKKSVASFEASLNELEQLVETMERGELSLEESLSSFERGIKLTRTCQKAIKEAEQKVQILLQENGEQTKKSFTNEP